MDRMQYFAAFFVAWLVLLLYLWNLSGRLSSLQRELELLKRHEDREARPEQ